MNETTTNHKPSRQVLRRARAEAQKLLESERLFNAFLEAVKKDGLVGEEDAALVLFVASVSRLRRRPLCVFVKGHSSSGKNWLVTRVLGLMPKSAFREITSASAKAWNYGADDFRHRVVYLQERNAAASAAVESTRTLISEGKLIREIAQRENGQLVKKKYVARGPIAAISTTTKARLEIDDETRHLSIWVDESVEQTQCIIRACSVDEPPLTAGERRIWRMVHRQLAKQIGIKIRLPNWFQQMSEHVFAHDLRVRRYFHAFVEACKTVTLMRSFQSDHGSGKSRELCVNFADFAIATLIFNEAFVESLHRQEGPVFETRDIVQRLGAAKGGAIGVSDLAKELNISNHRAYKLLREAREAGTIHRANPKEKSNPKRYLPSSPPRFIPDPRALYDMLDDVEDPVRFVHPLTGAPVLYTHRRTKK
jgi:hypothetical protein